MAENKKTSKFLGTALLGLLGVSLVGFGTGGFGTNVSSIGKVGDTTIDANDYARALNQELRSLGAQFGQNITFAQAQQFGIDRSVLQRVIAQTALDNETTRLGLSVGDSEVAEQVREIQTFHGLDGRFDRESYSSTLQRTGLSEAEFEAGIRNDAARNLLLAAITTDTTPSDAYVDLMFSYLAERRDITWGTVSDADLDTTLTVPTPAELQAFYDANPATFTTAEAKRLTYVWLTPAMLADTIKIDEETLRELYEERIDQYVQPERRLVERLVFEDQEAAEAAAAQLAVDPSGFETLVLDRGLSLEDIDLGPVAKTDLDSAADAVFSLDDTGFTAVVETNLGPAIFRVNAILTAQETPFSEAFDDLASDILADRAARQIQDQASGFDEELASGATLEDLAAESDLTLGTIDWTPDADQDITAYDGFGEAALIVGAEDFPEIFELEDGGIFALRLDEIIPSTLQPLRDVKRQVTLAWRQDQRTVARAAKADAAADNLRAGAALPDLGLDEVIEQDLTRSDTISGVGPDLVQTAFEMAPGDVRTTEGNGATYIVRLDAVKGPDVENAEITTLRDAIETAALQDISQDILDAFTAAVQADARVQLDQGAINAIHASFN
jgi:peptidyl-prolyl cis-trans isomerase D